MLSVVTWKWETRGYRTTYTAEHVNTMQRMVARHYPHPHRFVCVTDDASGLDSAIDVVPLWDDWRDVPSPHGGGNPSCYVRLKAFAPDMAEQLGERFVSVDLDAVIMGDLSALWNRDEDFVIWQPSYRKPGSNGPQTRFNGSMWMLRAGTRPDVWTRFEGAVSGRLAYQAGQHGSDQGWMQYVLGADVPSWGIDDGVFSYKFEILKLHRGMPPAHACLVFFHGKPDCWEPEAYNRHDWIREHYQ